MQFSQYIKFDKEITKTCHFLAEDRIDIIF